MEVAKVAGGVPARPELSPLAVIPCKYPLGKVSRVPVRPKLSYDTFLLRGGGDQNMLNVLSGESRHWSAALGPCLYRPEGEAEARVLQDLTQGNPIPGQGCLCVATRVLVGAYQIQFKLYI